ncbi:MAG: FAD-dependent oxidoreductase [Woeseiaceae bacterium]|nr:FAD-dependent oxidoreductase [Woeseiaceae bacterium]
MRSIAIIGAGLSGLVLAQRLQTAAHVTIFEKSRGTGGRMATRYAGDYSFDHGAQFITARSTAFREFLEPLIEGGIVADWPARFAEIDHSRVSTVRQWSADYPHFVGKPAMNRIGKSLASGLSVVLQTRVSGVERRRKRWVLRDQDQRDLGEFDWVVLTAPAPQTAALGSACPELVSLCRSREMSACYALMLGYSQPLSLPWDAALVRNADISWVSVNSSKPARGDAFTLLAHSTNRWADAHISDDEASVVEHMMEALERTCGAAVRSHDHRQLHRWRYANIARQTGDTCFVDESLRLAACGDWFVRGRVEAAFTSANDLAGRLRPLMR